MSDNTILWQPDDTRRQTSQLYEFMQTHGFDSYDALYRWSLTSPALFWDTLAQFCGVEFVQPPRTVLQPGEHLTQTRWFTGSTLNYAQHLLRRRGAEPALIFCREDGFREVYSFDQLYERVASLAAWLRAQGVGLGDRVCGYLPNCPQTVIAMLATASLGAVWSSCSPDFGRSGAADRFGQIEPKILFACNGYWYDGKCIDRLPEVAQLSEALPSLVATVILPFIDSERVEHASPSWVAWGDAALPHQPLTFAAVPFDHPLFIMFSSGTTGVPKCIVHGHGGTLLQHLKELRLHVDLQASDRLFYFTTCGWMMWNWMVSGLAVGSTLVLYDGAPLREDGRVLWRLVQDEKVTVFGTSAKYLSALQKQDVAPVKEFELSGLRTLLSTGSPLAPESFDYVYEAIGGDLLLGSISGGTDILGCFAVCNPLLPVRRGEIQCRALGMAVAVFDEHGVSLADQRGELVCTAPFPSMPIGFWGDPDGARYQRAYFEQFPNVWAHGDFAQLTASGGVIIHGRSDTVLNPGGVRIGTAEIYRQVEKVNVVLESLAVGQDWQDDTRVILFLVLREGQALTPAVEQEIRQTIRRHTTPRHVPAKIIAVDDLPRTKSGKLVEVAVRNIINGRKIAHSDALANPECLNQFHHLPILKTE